ncbi:hypothetical protein QM012_006924 [Aureobasidium pullulans]|uniref:Uncharacterized protein n=1 Tax=Aureobasidium pullulans TaxID=5580 RepID=A0ABR0TQ06_AURPU
MPSLTNILLHSIAYMAEKFPDKWMEKIPYYREREEEIEQEEREARRARNEKRRHSRSHKRSSSHRRSRHYDDDEQSESYDDEDYDRRDRRRHRSLDGRRQHAEDRSSYRRSYNPADYVPVDRYGFAVQAPGVSRPVVNGPIPGATPATTSFSNGSRPTSTSGPIPGYVPYANVYNTPAQSRNYSRGRESRDSPRGSLDHLDRRDYRPDQRGGRYHDNRHSDSDEEIKYRRRSSRFD